MTNKLVIFAGPSGTGKTTIVRRLLSLIPDLCFSISATTRPCREGEKHGKDYYFLSLEDFKTRLSQKEFVEYEEVYTGNYYGTLKSEIERIWALNRQVIFDIDVVGALNIKKIYPEQAISILVMPPSLEELKRRLEKRGTETPESLIKRMGKAESELAFADRFDKTLINDSLPESIDEAFHIVQNFIHQ